MAIRKKIITTLKKSKKVDQAINLTRFLQSLTIKGVTGENKKYPKVIQLPITYNCNSKCLMCNIWQMDHSNEADVEEFGKFLQDPIFKKVEAVGINGGEPSLLKNLPDFAAEILKLPSLTSLNIISHGFNKKAVLDSIEKIYSLCQKKGVTFHVSISLDGYDQTHNTVRGMKRVFNITTSVIDEISSNKSKYCDSIDVGCTVVNQNVDNLVEFDVYKKKKNYNVKYRLGIENKRIESDKLTDQFSVLYNTKKQSAKEFFHYQISEANSLRDKFKYFSIFYWLNSPTPKRLLGCMWQEEGVTLDSRGELYYCAVASKKLGSLREEEKDGEAIFFSDENLNYRKEIINDSCNNCIHDYSGRPKANSFMIFMKYMLLKKFSMKIYQLKGIFL